MRLKKYLGMVLTMSLCLTGSFGSLLPKQADAADTVTSISTAAELLNITSAPAGNYKLTADIDLTELTKRGGTFDTSGHGWTALVDEKVGFSGTLDGDGHKIIGMHVYGDCGHTSGLISYLKGGTIKNLGMVDCYFEDIKRSAGSGYRLGVIAADSDGGTISNCYATGTIRATRPTTSASTKAKTTTLMYVGGIAGVGKCTITNCYSNVNITVDSENPADGKIANVGGIVGLTADKKEVSYCYTAGGVRSLDSTTAYAVSGMYIENVIKSCYYLNTVTVTAKQEDTSSTATSGSAVTSAEPASAPEAYVVTNQDWPTSVALTDAQMKVESSFSGFDFTNTWIIDNSGYAPYQYPQLKSNFQTTLKDLELISAPTQRTYSVGAPLDLAGGKIKVTYEDGVPHEMQITDSMISGYDKTKPGTQTVSVSLGGKSVSFVVTVVGVPIKTLALKASSTSVNKGKTLQITATWTPSDATQTALTWTSSNTKIATVTNKGLVTGVGKGTATITAMAANGVKAAINITVKIPVTKITLNITSLKMNKGKTKQLTATITPSDTTSKITWASSNKEVATVSSTGLVKIVGTGNVKVVAKSKTDGIKGVCKIKATLPIKKGKIASVSNIYGRKIRVKTNKLKYASGYQIRYSRYSSMSGASSKKSTSKTLTSGKLIRGKKYYVQIRGYYNTTTEKKFYGAWSAKKTVTIRR